MLYFMTRHVKMTEVTAKTGTFSKSFDENISMACRVGVEGWRRVVRPPGRQNRGWDEYLKFKKKKLCAENSFKLLSQLKGNPINNCYFFFNS